MNESVKALAILIYKKKNQSTNCNYYPQTNCMEKVYKWVKSNGYVYILELTTGYGDGRGTEVITKIINPQGKIVSCIGSTYTNKYNQIMPDFQ